MLFLLSPNNIVQENQNKKFSPVLQNLKPASEKETNDANDAEDRTKKLNSIFQIASTKN